MIEEKNKLLIALKELKNTRISELLAGGGESATVLTGDPWLPRIPEGWSLMKLKRLGEVRSGVAKGKKHEAGVRIVELPYMRVANVQDGYIDLKDVAVIDVAEQDVDRYTLRVGDVLMNEGGDFDKLGRGAVWEGLVDGCLHQNHVFAVRLDDVEWAPWLAGITRTSYAKFYFMNNSKQSTNLASINQTNVKEFPVAMPPKEVRDGILKSLHMELDRISELNEHVVLELKMLTELRSCTITDAVLGRVRIPNNIESQIMSIDALYDDLEQARLGWRGLHDLLVSGSYDVVGARAAIGGQSVQSFSKRADLVFEGLLALRPLILNLHKPPRWMARLLRFGRPRKHSLRRPRA